MQAKDYFITETSLIGYVFFARGVVSSGLEDEYSGMGYADNNYCILGIRILRTYFIN